MNDLRSTARALGRLLAMELGVFVIIGAFVASRGRIGVFNEGNDIRGGLVMLVAMGLLATGAGGSLLVALLTRAPRPWLSVSLAHVVLVIGLLYLAALAA